DGETVKESCFGNGPVDALYKTIIKMTGFHAELKRFSVSSITGGTDAQGEVTVELKDRDTVSTGQGADPDILVASAKALVNALNRMEFLKNKRSQEVPHL
ncbi:MAG TPA: alpha-isopropylmalate synthase regulatory domain-containing protein, partial [Deltaproteobacteria bacterium]|nr:alpha-isopropylmalate synthase regulatory domain-containing protein [Deltaproteobacteria bacterium]